MEVDLTRIKPYGDTLNDGLMQLSFTLPIDLGDEAAEAARQLVGKMGFDEPKVVFSQSLGKGFSFYIVYGRCRETIDITTIRVEKVNVNVLSKKEIEDFIKQSLGRSINVIGACIESDAHTVGIDAIMNMKGYNGHKGLESYKGINALNLGAQVTCEELAARAMEIKADAVLISQVVTQKDIHIANLTRLIEILEAEGVRDKLITVVGGPRIDHALAQELGYDAGFGPGTYAEHVASYLVHEIHNRQRR
ncbi:MAG: OAM dimerization domain-containing protein [Bacillota bacterium]